MVQGGCGAGECAVWCRARVVDGMVQNEVQGVVQGECGVNVVQASVV